jgi:hypothetical protein
MADRVFLKKRSCFHSKWDYNSLASSNSIHNYPLIQAILLKCQSFLSLWIFGMRSLDYSILMKRSQFLKRAHDSLERLSIRSKESDFAMLKIPICVRMRWICQLVLFPRLFAAYRAIPLCNSRALSLGSRDDSALYCRRVLL